MTLTELINRCNDFLTLGPNLLLHPTNVNEINSLPNQFKQLFNEDLESIKPDIQRLGQFEFGKFSDPTFLINKVLSFQNESSDRPTVITILLAQLYICREVTMFTF